MPDNTRKPSIRFKGFTDDWEQRKVNELASETCGGGTPSTSNDEFWNGPIPWIQSSDLTEHKVFGVTPRKYISNVAVLHSATKIIPKNSLAIITRVGVGKLAIMPFLYTTSQDFLSLSKLKIDVKFTAYLLYKKLQGELNAVQGTSIKGITKDELLAKVVAVPERKEQEKIGSFFTAIDNLIILHQRKYDKLVNIKKSMLEKMFPRNGAKVPEIRFAGFTDAWEQRKLEDGTSKIGDGLHGTPIYSENGAVFFVNGNNFVNGKIVFNDETKHVTELEQSIDDKSLDANTILMSINGTIGNLAYYNGEKIMLGKSAAYISIRDFDKKFLYVFLQTDLINQYFMSSLTGTTIKNLGLKTIRETIIQTPSIREQSQIGTFFSNLDNLITLHQREVEKLKNIKKSCLEKMFI